MSLATIQMDLESITLSVIIWTGQRKKNSLNYHLYVKTKK